MYNSLTYCYLYIQSAYAGIRGIEPRTEARQASVLPLNYIPNLVPLPELESGSTAYKAVASPYML